MKCLATYDKVKIKVLMLVTCMHIPTNKKNYLSLHSDNKICLPLLLLSSCLSTNAYIYIYIRLQHKCRIILFIELIVRIYCCPSFSKYRTPTGDHEENLSIALFDCFAVNDRN